MDGASLNPTLIAELAAGAVVILAAGAEMLHARRARRLAPLAFGPSHRPSSWARSAPVWRVAALGAMCWGMVTLVLLTPKIHAAEVIPDGEYRHVLLVLDVSPSMRLQDAGVTGEDSRMKRASEVMESFFKRVAIEQYRISVVACYTGAKAVVVDTKDIDVVRNILGDLPMHYAFKSGKTDIFAGLEEAAKIAYPWNPKSTTVVLVSDGDTVPATGMPKMPASVSNVLVIGVGDPQTGSFIDGRQSKQESSTLRQVATRLRGIYHNANEKHISTDTLKQITQVNKKSRLEKLTRREFALIALGSGATIYALLPLLLHLFGTTWKPGVRTGRIMGERVLKVIRSKDKERVSQRTNSRL